MRLFTKIVLISVISIIFCIGLCFFILSSVSYFVNPDKYKEDIFKYVEKETGFKVSCEKAELKKSFRPYLKLHLYHTGVMYPDNTVFFQVKEADLTVKTLPLLFKKIEIKNAGLERPIINITLYKDSTTSLEKYAVNKNKKMTNGYVVDKIFSSLEVKNCKIKFKDDSINKIFYLEGDIYGNLKHDKKNNVTGNLKIENLIFNFDSFLSLNNYAELVFNNNEINIKSLIHTSNSDNAFIDGKFRYGKKYFIDINTFAKNINLENLSQITSVITKILNIKNPLNDIKAKGFLNADFNIKSDLKELKSKGKIELINAFLLHKKFKYPISNINAEINFDNNKINIEKAQADINKNFIFIKGLIKNDLTADLSAYSDNIDIKAFSSVFADNKTAPFNIQKGNLKFKTEIKGTFGKNLKSFSDINIKDLNILHKGTKIPINAKKIKIKILSENNKFNGNADIDNIDLKYDSQTIKSTKFDFTFEDKNINIPKNIVVVGNSPVMAYGYINNGNNKQVSKLNFEGDIAAYDAALFLSKYIKLPYKALGKLNSKGSISIDNNKVSLETQIKADRNNYISYFVIKELLNKPSIIKFQLEADKNIVTLKEISLSDLNELKVKISGQILKEKDTVLKNINLLIPNAITLASNFFGGEEISLKSNLCFNKNIKKTEINGNIKILKYYIKKYLTSIKNADISFSPQNIRASLPDITVNNSKLNITADINPDLNNLIISDMHLNSMNLDVNSLFGVLSDIKKTKFFMAVKNGSATVNDFKLLNLKARDISSNFKIDNNILKIFDINANAYSGSLEGHMNYEFPTGFLEIDMTGKNINIKPSLYDLCKYDDNISGLTDIKVNVSMHTGSYNTVIKSLSGSLEFNAKNGSMGTLGRFEYYLYAKNLLYHGLLNATINSIIKTIAHDDTTHFVKADGKILLQNGKLITDNIHTQGNNMSLFIKGRHNIFTNQSNLDIYGRISDEISKKLGSFADISISEIINGQSSQKNNVIISVPERIINEIKPLYNKNDEKSNMFKVNAAGNLKAFNSINSFMWIVPEIKNQNEEPEVYLPDFSDLQLY